VFVVDDGGQEPPRCDGCGQTLTVTSGDVRPTRCAECVASRAPSASRQRAAPVSDSFSIHSLVGDTGRSPSSGRQATKRPSAATSGGAPFLVHATAHAQYYALAASGLLSTALDYGGRASRVGRGLPVDWTTSPGLAAKHRYGV